MKKVILAISTIAVMFSCSSDDDSGSSQASLEGSWELTAFTVQQPVDIDGDGTASSDVLDEVPCFDGVVTFNGDGTFVSNTDELIIDFDTETQMTIVDCGDGELVSGTWELNGSTLTTTVDGESESETIDLDGDQFSFEIADAEFGTTTLVYTRQ